MALMKRRTLACAIVAVTVAVSACSSTRTEVRTNNSTTLDCPSETVEYAVFDHNFEAPGSPLPSDALAVLSWDIGVPRGEPEVESKVGNEVVFVYTDADGNRLGRVVVVRPETGWFIQRTERCS